MRIISPGFEELLFILRQALVSHHTSFLSKEPFPKPRHGCKTGSAFACLQLAEMVETVLRGPFLLRPSLLSGSGFQVPVYRAAVLPSPPKPPLLPAAACPRPVLPPARGSCGEVCVKNKRSENARSAAGLAPRIHPLPPAAAEICSAALQELPARPRSVPAR